jgi:Heavy metal binding domain
VNRNSNFLLLGSLIAGVVVLGVGLLKHGHTEKPKVGACGDTAPAYWYDPMAPEQRFDKPGKSPFMDMQLVPKCAATAEAPSGNTPSDAASGEHKPLYWFDPMKPQQLSSSTFFGQILQHFVNRFHSPIAEYAIEIILDFELLL